MILLLLVTFLGEKGLYQVWELNRYYHAIQERTEKLKQDNELLKGRITALKENDRAIESEARRLLGLVSAHEILVELK